MLRNGKISLYNNHQTVTESYDDNKINKNQLKLILRIFLRSAYYHGAVVAIDSLPPWGHI